MPRPAQIKYKHNHRNFRTSEIWRKIVTIRTVMDGYKAIALTTSAIVYFKFFRYFPQKRSTILTTECEYLSGLI